MYGSRVSPSQSGRSSASRFEAKCALLYLVNRNGKASWEEMAHGLATVYFTKGAMWLDHTYFQDDDPFRIARYARIQQPRSVVFRNNSRGGPSRIALRLKSKDLLRSFIDFAEANDIEIPTKKKSSAVGDKERHKRGSSNSSNSKSTAPKESSRRAPSISCSRRSESTLLPPLRTETESSKYHSRATSHSSSFRSGHHSRFSSSLSCSEPAAVVTSDPRDLPVALVVVPRKGKDYLMKDAGFTTTSVQLPPGLPSLSNRIVLCNVTNLPTVQALLFVEADSSGKAEVLMFDRDVNSGYQVDAEENFGLEPICELGQMPRVGKKRTKEAARTMRRVVKEALSEAMYKEIGRILTGTLRTTTRKIDYDDRHFDL